MPHENHNIIRGARLVQPILDNLELFLSYMCCHSGQEQGGLILSRIKEHGLDACSLIITGWLLEGTITPHGDSLHEVRLPWFALIDLPFYRAQRNIWIVSRKNGLTVRMVYNYAICYFLDIFLIPNSGNLLPQGLIGVCISKIERRKVQPDEFVFRHWFAGVLPIRLAGTLACLIPPFIIET